MDLLQNFVTEHLLKGNKISAISGGIALFFLIMRLRIITLFTATEVERLFHSKEKKFLVKRMDRAFQTSLITIFLLCASISFIGTKNKYLLGNILVVFSVVLILGFFIYLYKFIRISFGVGFNAYFSTASNKKNTFIIISVLVYFLILLLIVPVLAGMVVVFKVNPFQGTIEDVLEFLKALLIPVIVLFIIAYVYRTLFSIVLKFISDKISNNTPKRLCIKKEYNSQEKEFYIYHLVDSKHFILGDQDILENSNVQCFITREDLMKEYIYVKASSE